jgi:hypothetical protein
MTILMPRFYGSGDWRSGMMPRFAKLFFRQRTSAAGGVSSNVARLCLQPKQLSFELLPVDFLANFC